MSIEKSLLMYEDVQIQIHEVKTGNGLQVPIGVTASGDLKTVLLHMDRPQSHMYLFGKAGSGVAKTVEFIITALSDIYWKDLILNYVDGEGHRVKFWKNTDNCSMRVMAAPSSRDEFKSVIHMLYVNMDKKDTYLPEIVVFDHTERFIAEMSDAQKCKFFELMHRGASKNTHVLLVSQIGNKIPGTKASTLVVPNCDLIMSTRIDEGVSEVFFDSNIASSSGGIKKYGELVYSYRGDVERLRVPFCDRHRQ